jgi:tripartite-type tricarboxylate transporter receptor subunit TctC
MGATNNFVINQFMFPKTSFDPLTEFAPITRVALVPSVLYMNPAVPVKTLGDSSPMPKPIRESSAIPRRA